MSNSDAPGNAQAYARALLTDSKFSNARTYARTYRELLTFSSSCYVSNVRGGAAKNA